MITVTECENPVELVTFVETDRLFLNPLETNDWRIRRVIRDKVVACLTRTRSTPDGPIVNRELQNCRMYLIFPPTIRQFRVELTNEKPNVEYFDL